MCRRASHERGFVLVTVLWIVLLLAIIGGSLLRQVRVERIGEADAVARLRGELLAEAGINRMLLGLLDPADPLQPRLDGTPQVLTIAGWPVSVAVESEAGKIDLNAAPSSLLAALFRGQGMISPPESDALADHVAAWRLPAGSPAGDHEDNEYRDAGAAYGPRHAAFRSVGELRLVLGMTDALQRALEPLLTVYSRNSVIDRGVASDRVLAALADGGDRIAGMQIEARQQGNAAGVARAPAIGEAFTIRAVANLGGGVQTRVAVVRLGGDARTPYQIGAWRN